MLASTILLLALSSLATAQSSSSTGLVVITDSLPSVISTATATIPDSVSASASASASLSTSVSTPIGTISLLPSSLMNLSSTSSSTSTSKPPTFPNTTHTSSEPAGPITSTQLSTFTNSNGQPTSTATSFFVISPTSSGAAGPGATSTPGPQSSPNAGARSFSNQIVWELGLALVGAWAYFCLFA